MPKRENIVLLYCPCENETEASVIGKSLLEKKLAACINIIPGMRSAYWWEGAIQEAVETVLLVKTLPVFREKVALEIKNLHSYAVPAILSWKTGSENPAFTNWMEEAVNRD